MLVLLIAADEMQRKEFEKVMAEHSYKFLTAETIASATELLNSQQFDIIVSSDLLPDGTAQALLKPNLHIPVIITASPDTAENIVNSFREGPSEIILKDPDKIYLKLLPKIIENVYQAKKTEQLTAILSNAFEWITDGVCIVDNDHNICFVNPAFCILFGYEESELLNKPETILNNNFDEKITALNNTLKYPNEFYFYRRDRTPFPCSITRSHAYDNYQQKAGIVTIYRDISAHVAKEQLILKKTEELAISKTELEQLNLFSFVSTHDLQEPLHKIMMFGNLIKENPSGSMTQEYLDVVIQSSQLLSELIAQLHEYSSILRTGEKFQTIDLNEILNDVLEKLNLEIEQSNGKITVETLPSILGDQKQIYNLFWHLIHNGILFHQMSIPPEIHVFTRENEHTVSICIEDKGIGINNKFLSKLFQPFFRIGTNTKHPGKGMGLAICKRIMQRHRGTISVTSTLGKGSIFTITFPKAPT